MAKMHPTSGKINTVFQAGLRRLLRYKKAVNAYYRNVLLLACQNILQGVLFEVQGETATAQSFWRKYNIDFIHKLVDPRY
jgi:hypothetical protein